MPKQYPEEFKKQVVSFCIADNPLSAASEKYELAFEAEKIRMTLRECGIHVGKKRIREIMQELGLVSVRENAKSNYRNRPKYLKRNLLNQELKPTK